MYLNVWVFVRRRVCLRGCVCEPRTPAWRGWSRCYARKIGEVCHIPSWPRALGQRIHSELAQFFSARLALVKRPSPLNLSPFTLSLAAFVFHLSPFASYSFALRMCLLIFLSFFLFLFSLSFPPLPFTSHPSPFTFLVSHFPFHLSPPFILHRSPFTLHQS